VGGGHKAIFHLLQTIIERDKAAHFSPSRRTKKQDKPKHTEKEFLFCVQNFSCNLKRKATIPSFPFALILIIYTLPINLKKTNKRSKGKSMIPSLLIGQMLALIVALTYAENSLIYAYLGRKISVQASVHVRLWIATPLIIILALLTEGNFFIHMTLTHWTLLLLSGLLGYLFCDSLLFWAFATIGPREALVIMTLNPLFSSIFSYFLFSEVLTTLQIYAMIITLFGIILLILQQSDEGDQQKKKHLIKGTIFAFLASLLQSLSNILAKGALTDLGPFSSNAIRMIGGLIGSVILSVCIRKQWKNDFKTFANKKDFSLLFIASITGPVIGMSLLLTAFNYAPVGLTTAIVQISPLFILCYELLFLKKKIKPRGIIGTALAVAGVALMFI